MNHFHEPLNWKTTNHAGCHDAKVSWQQGRSISPVHWARTEEATRSTTDAFEGVPDAALWDIDILESHRPNEHVASEVWEILQILSHKCIQLIV